MFYTMYKLSFMQFRLISYLSHQFLIIYTKTQTFQNIKKHTIFHFASVLNDVSDVDWRPFELDCLILDLVMKYFWDFEKWERRVLAWFKLKNILEMLLRNKFEDASLKYFNVDWELDASGDVSPKSGNI